MKLFVSMVLMLALIGCARVTVTTEDPEGMDWDISYTSWFRKIEDVEAKVGDVSFNLGSAGIDMPVQNEVIACLIAPALCE